MMEQGWSHSYRAFMQVLICAMTMAATQGLVAQSALVQQKDSLQQKILSTDDSRKKVETYYKLNQLLLKLREYSTLLEMAGEGLELAKELQFSKGMAQMILHKAIALDILGRPDEALPIYNNGLKLAQSIGEKELEAKYYMNIGACHYFIGDLYLGLKNYLEAYERSDALSKIDLAKLLNNIGIIYRLQKKYVRAEEIYLKSYALKQELGDSLGMAASLMNLGLVNYKMANRADRAINYLKKSYFIYEKLKRPFDMASCSTSLGEVYLALQDVSAAKEELHKAWRYFEEHPNGQYSASTLNMLSQIAVLENDHDLAASYLEKAVEIAKTSGQKKNEGDLLLVLSEIKNVLGKKAEAYTMLKSAYAINDTLKQAASIEAMEEMQAKFDVKEKENELQINRLKLNKRTLQRNIFLMGTSFLAASTLFIFFFLRARINANKKIALQKEEIHKQQINELQQKNKLLALNSMIEGQEAERMRIAKDLHDGLGGLLSTVKAHFTTIQSEVGQLQKLNLTEKANELIDEACVEVRRISHNMIPHTLSISGFPVALEDIVGVLSKEGYLVELNIKNFPDDMVKTKQTMLFRLVQEVVSNIRKHAGAKQILIQILGMDQGLSLIIEDDGVGFDYEKAYASGGVGLKSINSRVEFLDGTIDWDTATKEGTTITINIPSI